MTRDMPDLALLQALERRLDPAARATLDRLVAEAELRAAPLYAVGGVVRDLLRESTSSPRRRAVSSVDPDLPFVDLDLAVEGDAAAIAAPVVAELDADVVRHDRFGTLSLRIAGATIDLARTRRERYARPGALPDVEPAPIEVDLARRDFSVNAMALALSGPGRGRLLDLQGGAADLERGLIRVLHAESFRDDPTRLIRACRYAARIDGRLAPGTGAQARASRRDLASLSADRFGEAWGRLLQDAAAREALRRAAALRLPQARQAGWALQPRVLRALTGLDGDAAGFWALCGLSLAADIVATLPRACTLLREERRALEDGSALRAKRGALGRASLPDSGAAALLRPHGDAAKRAAALFWRGRAGERAGHDLREWVGVGSPIDAAELIALGVPPGPAVGAGLRRLRDAVIDGDLRPGRRGAAAARRLVREQLHSPGSEVPRRPVAGRDEEVMRL